MRIPESKIAEIAAVADIVQVISDYVDLKRAGKDYKGRCPFHSEKTASFFVSPGKGIFHCFGCGIGGSIFNFLMKIENVTFTEAVRMLASRYGVVLHYDDSEKGAEDDREKLFKALRAAQRYFENNLRSSRVALDYLTSRGVSSERFAEIGFGYAPDLWEGIQDEFRRSGVSIQDAVAAGLLRPRSGNGHYDYFRSRIMIPIRNLKSEIVAFGGRIIGEGEPKYLNSPDTRLFKKKYVLFGLDSAREAIRSDGFVILVEGYFDQISLRLRGLKNTAAPLGTALGIEQVRLIKRFTTEVVTIFDGDEAGIRAAKKAIPLFLSEGMEPKCLILRDHKDPDEAITAIGEDGFRKLLDGESVPMIDFFLESLGTTYDLTRIHGRNLALEECIPVLKEIADSSGRDYLIERFCSRLSVREDRIRRILFGGQTSRRSESQSMDRRSSFVFPAHEKNVVRGMLSKAGFSQKIVESGIIKDFQDPTLANLAELVVRFEERHGRFDPVAFARSLEDERLASLVAGWLKPTPEEDDLRPEVDGDRALEDSFDKMLLLRLEKRKREIQERMKGCSPGDSEYNFLAGELWAIGRRLHK